MTNSKRPDDADFGAAYDVFARCAVEVFTQQGEVQPQFFAVMLGEESGTMEGYEVVDPRFVHRLYQSSETKDLIKPVIHMLLADDSPIQKARRKHGKPRPDLVVQISECWMAKEIERDEAGEVIPPSERADRTEAVVVAVHTLTRTELGYCPILDVPTRHCEFVPIKVGDATYTGRMSMSDGGDLSELTSEQREALLQFANRYGADWKRELLDRWVNGTDTAEPGGHLLRQVRNRLGPQWLEKVVL